MIDIATTAHTPVRSLEGRRVLVSGGTTGIGRATAVLLAQSGARVFVCGRDPGHLSDALEAINAVGEGAGITCDLGEAAGVHRFVDEGVAWLGGLDVAVLNAAVPAQGLTEMSEADLLYAIATDFTAYMLGAQLAAARMDGGDIVFTGSMSAHVLGPHSTVYAGIKAGIAGFSEALRKELGDKNVRVALIEPGKTKADFSPDATDEEQRKAVHEETTLRAQDIAVGIHFVLTQPERTVVQQLTIVPRAQTSE